MELNSIPKQLRNEAQVHILDGYKLENFENNLLIMSKKKPFRLGMFIINILTLRWMLYLCLPNILVLDLIRIKYYLYIKKNENEVVIYTR